MPVRSLLSRGAQKDQAQREHGHADRDVDQKYPMPIQRARQQPTQQHPDTSAAGAHEAEDPHRLRTLGLLREQSHDQRERHRVHDGTSQTLHRSGDDEPLLRVGQAAGE